MRSFKFRAWRKKERKWITDLTLMRSGLSWVWHHGNDLLDINWCQFTGLTDESGKEIWEGDVVNGNEVVFEDGVFYLRTSGTLLKDINWASRKVSGNKFENPELLI